MQAEPSTQSAALNPQDARLLNLLQQEVPLVDRPFAALGEALGMSEAEVIHRIGALKAGRGVVRQISAIFDSRALGYAGSLVAAKVPEDRIDAAAAAINQHPGVSHNYRRNHAYNLWYTLALPPDSRLGLEGTVHELHRRSGATVTRLLPSLRLYKIGVKLDLAGESDATTRADDAVFDESTRQHSAGFVPTDADKRLIRVLQQDLPAMPRPFDDWARQAHVSVDELLSAARHYARLKVLRRFSAVLRHRAAGFSANAMGAWIVPPEQRDNFGRIAATFAAVSHCYQRPTYEDWPYSIFTMVHAPTQQECEAVLAAISAATGIARYAALYSTHEYKKVRVKYFQGDIEAWEREAMQSQAGTT